MGEGEIDVGEFDDAHAGGLSAKAVLKQPRDGGGRNSGRWLGMTISRLMLCQAVFGAIVLLLLTLTQGYDLNWDDLNYHFYNGFAFVHHRTWSNIQVAMRQSYFYPLLDAIFYGLVKTLPPWGVALSLALVQSALYPLLFALGMVLLRPFMANRNQAVGFATLTALLGILAPVNILEAGGAYGDNTTAIIIIVAVLLCVIGANSDFMRRQVYCFAAAGACAGLATAIKLTNAPFAVGLAVAVTTRFFLNPRERSVRSMLACWAAIGVVFLLAYGPWGAQLWVRFGNPFFPFFNQIFRSRYAAPVAFSDPAFLLPSFWDKLLFPFIQNPVTRHDDFSGLFDARIAIALPLLIACVALKLSRRLPQWAPSTHNVLIVSLFFLASYTAWLLAFAINRYMVVLEMLTPVACVACLAAVIRRPVVLWSLSAAVGVIFLGSAYAGQDMILRSGDHRAIGSRSYFNVAYPQVTELGKGGSLVVMLGEQPIAFTIPYFPINTSFVRLTGSLYYGDPAYSNFAKENAKGQRASVFGNAMGKLICGRLDKQTGPLFTLRPAGGPDSASKAALTYYGISEVEGQCIRVSSKAGFDLWLCKAVRRQDSECSAAAQ